MDLCAEGVPGLRVDTRKWYLSKVLPKKFGDKLDMTRAQSAARDVKTGKRIKDGDDAMDALRYAMMMSDAQNRTFQRGAVLANMHRFSHERYSPGGWNVGGRRNCDCSASILVIL